MSLRLLHLWSLSIFGCVATAGVWAAGSDADADVLVTATRTPTPADEILVPTITITRADIERSLAGDVADLLRFHAGLDIGRNGGPGQPASLFLRGTNSNHTVVLVDGVRINPGTIGGAPLENIDPQLIERIEIVKGPRSALYGSDAIGGVVNILTRGTRTNGIDAAAGLGRYGTRTASLAGGMQFAAGGFGFNASSLASDGFPPRSDSATDRGYRNLSLGLQGRWQAGAVEWRAHAWRAAGTSEYSDFFLTPVDEDFDDQAGALEASFAAHSNWRMRIAATLMRNDLKQNQSTDRVRTRRYGIEWQNDLALDSAGALTFGAQASREHVDAVEFQSYRADTDMLLAFAEDRLQLGRHRLLAAAGYTHHDTAGSKWTWNLDYGYDLGAHLRMFVTWGTAFRAPDSTDRFGFGGNPDLAPESSRNLELGLDLRPSPAQRITLSAFRNRIDDLIVFVVTDPVTFDGINRNVERVRIDGIEASYRGIAGTWQLQVAATAQDPRNLSEDSQLLRRTRTSLSLSLLKSLGRFRLGLDLLSAGARKDFGFPSAVTLAPYALLDLTGQVELSRQLELDARLENALDERYQLAQGYNTPRRGLFVSVRYRFDTP